MQRMSERGEHRLVEGFTHRRMGADRQGEPKGGGRFRHARAGGVDLRTTLLSARVTTRTKPSSPFTTEASPSRTARVRNAAASEPEPGSVRP